MIRVLVALSLLLAAAWGYCIGYAMCQWQFQYEAAQRGYGTLHQDIGFQWK